MYFEGLPGVVAIADYIVVFCCESADHDASLYGALQRSKEMKASSTTNTTASLSSRGQCSTGAISDNGFEPDHNKIKAIPDMPSSK